MKVFCYYNDKIGFIAILPPDVHGEATRAESKLELAQIGQPHNFISPKA